MQAISSLFIKMLQNLNKVNPKRQYFYWYILYIYKRYKIRRKEMTFLALNIDKSYLIHEKSDLEYQEMIITNEYNYVTSELADYATAAGEKDSGKTMDDSTAKALQSYQQLYDSQRQSIESKLEVINAEVESFGKAVSTNVKSECKLNISV